MNAPMNLMVFEDERTCLATIKKMIEVNFPDIVFNSEDNPYHIFCTVSIHRPEILIVDFQYNNFKITDQQHLMIRLLKFKGLVCMYSGHPVNYIKKEILKQYNLIPKNFRIISKTKPMELLHEIKQYYKKRQDGLDVAFASTSDK